MSRPEQDKLECPSCGRKNKFTVWRLINVTLDPELKDKLLGGELMTFTCKKCGHQAPTHYTFLYHDMEHRRMVWLLTGVDSVVETVNAAAMLQKMAGEPYTLRRVTSIDELIEKILIWDSGFDDRMMELYKLGLREQLVAEEQHSGSLLYTNEPGNRAVEGVLEFVMVTSEGPTPMSVPAQTYHELAEQAADLLASVEHDPHEWLRVDQEYARSLMGE